MTPDVDSSGSLNADLDGTITALAPTLAALLGVDSPVIFHAAPVRKLLEAAGAALGNEHARRCLIYAPDAFGLHLAGPASCLFDQIRKVAPVEVRLRSMRPSKTPVCFASMFTGAPPEVHGIRRYERPALTCDTIFDVVLRAGKRVAIVAVEGCSMDLIFRGRAIDYFSEDYDPEVTEATLGVLQLDRHDLVVAYHQEYDDLLHETTPFSPRALRAAERHVESFRRMARVAHRAWRRHPHAVVFAPDHGAVLDPATGKGTHGGDSPDEMNVAHFWGFRRGRKTGKEASKGAEDEQSI
ncbi:hypothetical protein JXA88_05265 [Candidatus Fermentibacteria bacterium]|nr:hypothetical protein [Candidatus Fermentibacteria bacterium]